MLPQIAPQLHLHSHLLGADLIHGSYNSLPASPRFLPRRGSDDPNRYSLEPYRASRITQQYARPLQRTNSYPSQGYPKEDGGARAEQSEHMLRRKTPNGILAAAYDGTSVEQTEKPHAMKHILLPISAASRPATDFSPFGYGMKQELPLRAPAIPLADGGKMMQPQPQPPTLTGHWNSEVDSGHGTLNQNWMREQYQLPQIDSMINQIPLHHPQLPYQPNHYQFQGNVLPPFQAPIGPTASGEQGPYGPYWPNGTFIPYRPAALKDPRYYHQQGASWPSSQHVNFLNQDATDWQALNKPLPSFHQQELNPFLTHPQLPNPGSLNGHHNLQQQYLQHLQQNEPNNAFSPTQYQVPQLNGRSFGYGSEATVGTETFNFCDSSGQSTPVNLSTPGSSITAEPRSHANDAQLRESVFRWAHTVYVDYVAYIHHFKRTAQNGRHGNTHNQASRPNIYPKPPRQPGSNFASGQNGNKQVDDGFGGPKNEQSAIGTRIEQLTAKDQGSYSSSAPESRPQSHAAWLPNAIPPHDHAHQGGPSLPQPQQFPGQSSHLGSAMPIDKFRTLRRMSGNGVSISSLSGSPRLDAPPSAKAAAALDRLTKLCQESSWQWIEGMLLGGCLAYALGDYHKALRWYSKILDLDSNQVEAISNLAATLLALHRKQEAERYWLQAVKLRPSHFEAVEHLIGLLCGDHRGKEAVGIIEYVERSLKYTVSTLQQPSDYSSETSSSTSRSTSVSELSDRPHFDYEKEGGDNVASPRVHQENVGSDQPGFGSSGYAIPGSENGRMLALVHAKGNMLYALGDNAGAAKAFENAVLIGVGRRVQGIRGLINHILSVVASEASDLPQNYKKVLQSNDPILLPPDRALATAKLCFPNYRDLPGLQDLPNDGMARKAAISTTSNSLLSLAKIFQDGMTTSSPKVNSLYQPAFGVREILALYYLSLSLQPSPSTANNVGILLASVQQSVAAKQAALAANTQAPHIPGVIPGSGIALALMYYNYGLNLDSRHAHLFTNLGSLLKDIGQLSAAIKMYEQAVACDGNFDIALANLANAVKDQGRISDAITFYRRAVNASPDFAEAVCGLANALNSVCGWQGRGGIASFGGKLDRWHVDDKGMLLDARIPGAVDSGWLKRVINLVEKQLIDGESWGRGVLTAGVIEGLVRQLTAVEGGLAIFNVNEDTLRKVLNSWTGRKWEGARLVRLVERVMGRLSWQWYQDKFVRRKQRPLSAYNRPQLPAALTVPTAPTVLPFHTFTCPVSAKQIRLISQRNALRISCSSLKAPWLPRTVFPPPQIPNPFLKVGYVSSDFNNHPLAHLMQSVFGLHDPRRVKAYCYATTASDNSIHRQQIEKEAPVFQDASMWTAERLVNQIIADGIHILVNLNGYTRGARNEVFAARPAPLQMAFMGFAGTLGAEWCDYLLADETAVPPEMLRPRRNNVDLEAQLLDDEEVTGGGAGNHEDWVYGENIIYCRDTFFCCDHRQSAPDAKGRQLNWEEEQTRRWNMRKELFPTLSDDAVILGNFNQLYKIEPTTFRTWLRILALVPKAVLWLLRFPDLGETNLKQTAQLWAGSEVASRILFTDVAPKHQHIARARVCDLFLDTPECNAHTTAADVLWSGTPLLTLPRYKYKMCSRMAASILKGALPKTAEGRAAAQDLIASSDEEYEERAVRLARGCVYQHQRYHTGTGTETRVVATGRLTDLRKILYEARWSSALFDTRRWVRDLEEGYEIAWKRWERGESGDIWL